MPATFQINTIKDNALQEILNMVPIHGSFILVDECQWGIKEMEDRKAIPFLENNGRHWGSPVDDAGAVGQTAFSSQ